MKMKHLQSNTTLTIDHDDGHLINSSPSTHHSSASLNQISMKSHDFELRKRDFASNEHLAKKLRFFHKRKTKDLLLKSPLQAVSLTDDYFSSRTHRAFFGEPLDQLIKRHDDQLPPVIQVKHLLFFFFFQSENRRLFSHSAIIRSSLLQRTGNNWNLS